MKKIIAGLVLATMLLGGCSSTRTEVSVTTDSEGKYEPNIEMSSAITSDSLKFVEGDDLENNIWTRTIKEETGIIMKFLWSCPNSQWDQKWNVAIASGDIPDVMSVREKHYKLLCDNDMIQSIDGLVEEYGSDALKKLIAEETSGLEEYCMQDGKQMALPVYGFVPDDASIMYIRQDWLDKLGLSVPETMDELCNVAVAFTENDPDGNGEKDTFGIAAGKVLDKSSGIGSLCGFFNGYGAYLKIWLEGQEGLEYSSIQPEVKTALAALQDLYAKGALDMEFSVKDGTKASEDIAAGRAGIIFGDYWAAGNLKNSVMSDSSAKWTIAEIPGLNGEKAIPQATGRPNSYIVVSNKYKHPEALIKYLNVVVEKKDGPDAQKYHNEGDIGFHKYLPVTVNHPWKNLNAHLKIMDSLESGDTSNMSFEEIMYWDRIQQYKDGDITQYGTNAIFGKDGAYSIVNTYKNENRIITDAYKGLITETETTKGAALEKLEDEAFTNIIMGDNIDDFDEFVENWKKLGGSDLTLECNN